jgi:Animal haem peroxidase
MILMHGEGLRRGMSMAASTDGVYGRFGRMFQGLSGPAYGDDLLFELAKSMIKDDIGKTFNDADDDENDMIAAGYTYFGQFVDHDITFDITSLREKTEDAAATQNFRSSAFDLDSVYGLGLGGHAFLYDDKGRFNLSARTDLAPPKPGKVQGTHDHFRAQPPAGSPAGAEAGPALIGDPRNDENTIVAQIHLAFIAFHNRIIDDEGLLGPRRSAAHPQAPSDEVRFQQAARLARHHYQWVVVHDFLKKICDPGTYGRYVKTDIRPPLKYYPKPADLAPYAYMPIEFSVAAYRMGHSMVRPSYALNSLVGTVDRFPGTTRVPIFSGSTDPLANLNGFRPLPGAWGIDWGYFFDALPGTPPQGFTKPVWQPSYRMDTSLVDPLKSLPDHAHFPERERNLAFLNLRRGVAFGLPTAEQVASRIELQVPEPGNTGAGAHFLLMDKKEIWSAGSRFYVKGDDANIDKVRKARAAMAPKFNAGTPLWYYILREAEFYSTKDSSDKLGGRHLGPLGSTIVLETFLGLLDADPTSFVHSTGWRPRREIAGNHLPGDFGLPQLIRWALGGTN